MNFIFSSIYLISQVLCSEKLSVLYPVNQMDNGIAVSN